MSLPILLPEQHVRIFEYWHNGRICTGMSMNTRPYKLITTFAAADRFLAYEKGCELAAIHTDVVLTVATGPATQADQYRLWLPLAQAETALDRARQVATFPGQRQLDAPAASDRSTATLGRFQTYVKRPVLSAS